MLLCWITSAVPKTKRGPEVGIGLGPGRATLDFRGKPGDLRAATLYELEDLVRIAGQKNKHVILIARQCGICGRTRAQALRPLLTNPNLKLFSTLVMDAATAKELLEQESPKS